MLKRVNGDIQAFVVRSGVIVHDEEVNQREPVNGRGKRRP